MQQENIKATLQCLGYNRFIDPKSALNQSGPTSFYVARSIEKVIEINENVMNIAYEESKIYKFTESRLAFDQFNQGFWYQSFCRQFLYSSLL